MAQELTQTALNASSQVNIEPNIVLEIEGYDVYYGGVAIQEVLRFGNEGLNFGDPGIVFGGYNDISESEQSSLISFKGGTTTSIRQQLNLDKGTGDSISSMRIALVDKDEEITRDLLTPDENLTPPKDILGRRAKIWLGFNNTAFKDDYVVIFRGNIDSVESKAGLVLLNINHPDSKKKGVLFTPADTKLNGSINDSVTTITVDDTTDFYAATYIGPSGVQDTTFEYLLRIDDEVIKYTGKTPTTFTGLTRGYLGTTAISHSDDATVNSAVRITGNAIDIALKLMLSGWGGPFKEDIAVENFVRISATETVSNSIYFEGIDVESEYNLKVGDFITTTGASNGANNVSLKEIIGIGTTENGSYIVVDGVSFVEENDTSAVIDFRSQYDTYPSGAMMENDEVDIDSHHSVKSTFLSDDEHYDFRLQEEIELKEFIGEQIYNPLGAYQVPKNAQSSIGYHLNALLPTSEVKVLDSSNVINPKDITLTRSTNKNFFNAVVVKYEQSILDSEKYYKIYSSLSNDSRDRINVGVRALKINSQGFRDALGGEGFSLAMSTRRLAKFQYGAETLKPMRVNFQTGFNIEIGDIVLVDLADLKITDIKNGTRAGDPRLFEVINRELDIRSGKVILELIDSNFAQDTRYGLISPTSEISSGDSGTVFQIQQTWNHPYGTEEWKLWRNYIGAKVKVRNSDFSTQATSYITGISGNQITVSPTLGFTPTSGYFMELASYDDQPETIKAIYTFMSDTTFADGEMQYQML